MAEATLRLLAAVEAGLHAFAPVWEFPVPEAGRVRFVALTYQGAMAAEAGQAELDDRHPLALLYTASGAVLAKIQRLEAAMPDGAPVAPVPDPS